MKRIDKILKEVENLPDLVKKEGGKEDLRKLLTVATKIHEAIAELVDNVLLPNADWNDYHYYLFVSSLAKRGFLGRKAVWVLICNKEPECKLQCEKCRVFGNAVIVHDPNIGKEGFDEVTKLAEKMLNECGCDEILILRGVAK